jgi:hypothetical protein
MSPDSTDVLRNDEKEALEALVGFGVGDRAAIGANAVLSALPSSSGVAVEFQMPDTLESSYLWHDGDDYRASNLGPGLEGTEASPMGRHGAGALLDNSFIEDVVPLTEVNR